MEWWEILLCIIINAIWVIPISFELISSIIDAYKCKKKIQEANKQYNKVYGKRLRKLCVNCSYCIWKYYHPFSSYGKNYWSMLSKTPYYCNKLKKQLKSDVSLRCISEMNSDAMFEDDD